MKNETREQRRARVEELGRKIAQATNEELKTIVSAMSLTDVDMVEMNEIDSDRVGYLRVGGDAPRAWREHK